MVLNWNFNETWPTAAGNHIITWDHRKKPAYYAVKNALRMVMTSARNQKLMWYEGEVFEAELWVLNDSFDKQHIGEIHAFLEIDGKEYGNIQWTIKEVQAQANVPGPIFRTTLPKATDGIMTLHLKVAGKGEMDSDYQFIYRSQKEKNECCGVRVLNQ